MSLPKFQFSLEEDKGKIILILVGLTIAFGVIKFLLKGKGKKIEIELN